MSRARLSRKIGRKIIRHRTAWKNAEGRLSSLPTCIPRRWGIPVGGGIYLPVLPKHRPEV